MKAVILCAGKGKRMGFFGEHIPKPLFKVNGRSLLQRWFDYFKKYGITELCINTHHLAEKLENEIGDGSSFGVKINWFRQPKAMGTASIFRNFGLQNEKEPFIVVFGDTLLTVDLHAILEQHRAKNAEATILVNKHPEPWRKGVVTVDDDFRITHIAEKPNIDELADNQYCVHILSVVNPDLVSQIETDEEWLVEHFFTNLVQRHCRVYALLTEEACDDVNTIEDLQRLEARISAIEGKL